MCLAAVEDFISIRNSSVFIESPFLVRQTRSTLILNPFFFIVPFYLSSRVVYNLSLSFPKNFFLTISRSLFCFNGRNFRLPFSPLSPSCCFWKLRNDRGRLISKHFAAKPEDFFHFFIFKKYKYESFFFFNFSYLARRSIFGRQLRSNGSKNRRLKTKKKKRKNPNNKKRKFS